MSKRAPSRWKFGAFGRNVALDHLRAICAAEVATAWADIESLSAVSLCMQHGTLTGDQIETVLSNTPVDGSGGVLQGRALGLLLSTRARPPSQIARQHG